MTPDQFDQALVSGGSTWLVMSLAAILPILWTFTLILHFARPYVIRFLRSLTLRFGGDVWWLSYVLMRDALMLLTLALSVIFLMPNLYIGLGLPLTSPLAAVLLFWALVVKMIRDSDDDPAAFRLVSVLLAAASVLYIVPQIYGVEAADQVGIWDRLGGVGWLPGALTAYNGDTSWLNPLAWPILLTSLAAFGLTGGYLFTRFLLGLGQEEAAAEADAATRPSQPGGPVEAPGSAR
ncbi:MAG: hypothetical protein EPN50_06885 [Chloroflexota bacterium]|nr:MAG: hypothetical protein EPN50_06885 [Chloroflexota bacterium]